MKRTALSFLAVAFFFTSYAQFSPAGKTLTDDLHTVDYSTNQKLGKKAAGNKVSCAGDTLDYGRYKASALVGINISQGYRLGALYETPGEVTISGFDFYAWQNMGTTHVVEVYCEIYLAGADSLPSGAAVRSDTLYVDSTFGAGVLTVLRKRAVFDTPYKTSKPYIVVVSTNDTNRVAVVTNSYTAGDGDGENLGCGTVGGRWYQFDDLNIGGTSLDCDVLLEPHVDYTVFNDFSFKDCYDYNDTMEFTNKSSPFFFSKVYNRYKFFEIDQFSHRWDFYGTGSNTYMVEGQVKYPRAQNSRVRLISTQYHYRGGGTCIDTSYGELSYKPSEITFVGDKNICSGTSGTVTANTDGYTNWFRSPSDTTPFHFGNIYSTPQALDSADVLYAKAVNKHCESTLKRYVIEVTTTPDVPTVSNDSICLNSLANLIAKSNAGIIRWFKDSTNLFPVHTGEVFQVGPLKRDTFFFAKAENGACRHDERVRVTAFVSNDFAPAEPTISNDTTLCLLSDPIVLRASSTNELRWYDVAAGGTIIHKADTLVFTPQARGMHARYVDAYNGNCASSRLPINIEVHHFPELIGLSDLSGCEGEDLLFDFSNIEGRIDWYDMMTGGNTVFSGNLRAFDSIQENSFFYLEPYEGLCRDSVRHAFGVESIPFGKFVDMEMDSSACDLTIPTLRAQPDIGIVKWYDETGTNLIGEEPELIISPITQDITVFVGIDNEGCITPSLEHNVQWLLVPDANFDYQVVWRNVEYASRLIGQGDYVWLFGDGSDTLMGTDVAHYYSIDGEYKPSLTVTTPFGCADTVIKTIIINTLGINDGRLTTLSYYPNPAHSMSKIVVKSELNLDTYSITDAQGKLVSESSELVMHDGQGIIQLPEMAPGLYHISLKGEVSETNAPLLIVR